MNATQHNLSDVNVTTLERALSVFTGSALLLYGLRNRGVTAAGAAILGGGLLARGVTGEIHHVDAGYHIVGMKHPDAPDIVVGKD